MVFISFLANYNFTLLLVQHFGFNKFIISQFHPEQQLPKYYNDTWCTYALLRLHIPYTISGRGVTVEVEELLYLESSIAKGLENGTVVLILNNVEAKK